MSNTTAVGIADRLRALREAKGLSQTDLAHQAGIDRKTVNRIENGHYSPSMDTLVYLAEALGSTASDLLGK